MANTIQVVADPKLRRELQELAKAEKRSVSNVAAILLTEALAARQQRSFDNAKSSGQAA